MQIRILTEADEPALAQLLTNEKIKQTYMLPDFPLVYSCKICYHIDRRRSILVKAPFSRQGLKILRRAHR